MRGSVEWGKLDLSSDLSSGLDSVMYSLCDRKQVLSLSDCPEILMVKAVT